MPTVTVGGKQRPPQTMLPLPASDDALSLADVAWTLARMDAYDAIEQMDVVLQLAGRVQNGDRWMDAHPDHPKRYENGSLLYRLAGQLEAAQVRLRALERTCWQRCAETYAVLLRAGTEAPLIQQRIFGTVLDFDDDPPYLPLWRMLLPFRAPPEIPIVGGVPVILPRGDRTGAALWELDDLKEALERMEARRSPIQG